MRSLCVVFDHPTIDCLLRLIQALESLAGQEVLLQGLVEPLHLPGRRGRPGGGEEVLDAVLSADPVEEHLTGA